MPHEDAPFTPATDNFGCWIGSINAQDSRPSDMSRLKIIESHVATTAMPSPRTPKTYVLAPDKAVRKDAQLLSSARLDCLTQITGNESAKSYSFSGQIPDTADLLSLLRPHHLFNQLLNLLSTLFLPTGYPHSVTADYTPYQIYDSLQAFASTIAGLLSSRAVLQSLNVVSSHENDTNTATYATLLSIATSTLSNLTTIFFAARAAPRINADVKFYRFLADVVNDVAFVLDLLAPSLPHDWSALHPLMTNLPTLFSSSGISLNYVPSPRVLALCCSAVFRAICGVAGGSSKAVLSSHFARNNPEHVGELNAKDGSQETVVNLVGMWVGGVLVSRVQGLRATWLWMLGLLMCHLGANWMAVRSITFTWLNAARATLVLTRVRRGDVPDRFSVTTVGQADSILGLGSLLWPPLWKSWRIGASVEEFMLAFGVLKGETPGSFSLEENSLLQLVNIFEKESYILWYNSKHDTGTILLKQTATPADQLKAWSTSLEIHSVGITDRNAKPEQILNMIRDSVERMDSVWPSLESTLRLAGWDLSSSVLESGPGVRVELRP